MCRSSHSAVIVLLCRNRNAGEATLADFTLLCQKCCLASVRGCWDRLQTERCRCRKCSPCSSRLPVQPSVLSMLNRWRAISRKPFFTSLTRTLEQAKIHKHTCKYQSRLWAPESSNTSSSFFLSSLFILFIPLTASCPHLSRIYTPQAHKFTNSP